MMQLVGKERLEYVSKKTNRMVKGYNLHFIESSPHCEGMKTSTAYVSDDVYFNYFDIPLDSYVEVFYNSYRQVCGCKVYDEERR